MWLNTHPRTEQEKLEVLAIKIGGAISQQLAETWGNQIAEQLNENDAATVARARLSG